MSLAPQRLCLPHTLLPREKYWELVKMEDPQNDPQVCSEGSDEGDTWGNRGRNPQLPIPIRDALFGASCVFLGRSGITALWSPPQVPQCPRG